MLKKVESGFSLVELSLVLIIVALIIAAVVSGKSLITNSKLALLNSEMQTLRIAIQNYVNDYHVLTYEHTTETTKGISLYELQTNGYLEAGTVKIYNGSEASQASSTTDVFVSKYSTGGWNYVGEEANASITFGKMNTSSSAVVKALLPEIMIQNFQKKYEKAGSITVIKGDVVDTAASMTINFYDDTAN